MYYWIGYTDSTANIFYISVVYWRIKMKNKFTHELKVILGIVVFTAAYLVVISIPYLHIIGRF